MPFGLGGKKVESSTPAYTTKITDKEELEEIKRIGQRLDPSEEVMFVAKQSRFKPGGLT